MMDEVYDYLGLCIAATQSSVKNSKSFAVVAELADAPA